MSVEELPKNGKLNKLHDKIVDLRSKMVECNLPMAINRAKRFWSKTNASHLSYMDLVQIANEGLIIAIDKYVPPFSSVFRSVIIGRISCNTIQNYSETLLHFYPSDRKTLYLANKARMHSQSIEEITQDVNAQDGKTERSASQVQEIMNASSTVSIESLAVPGEEGHVNPVDLYAAPAYLRPDNQVEELDTMHKLFANIDKLPLLEKKVLLMKFGQLGL